MAHVIDSSFYGDGYSTPEIHAIFSERGQVQRWLDVEAALAAVQGELGVIPADAAREIEARCDLDGIDLERVREEIRRTKHSLVPLLRELQRVCRDGLGEFIHYGATTQDIEDTGAVLQMRDSFSLIHDELKAVARSLAELAETHRETVMPGRTHGQHALVTTFG